MSSTSPFAWDPRLRNPSNLGTIRTTSQLSSLQLESWSYVSPGKLSNRYLEGGARSPEPALAHFFECWKIKQDGIACTEVIAHGSPPLLPRARLGTASKAMKLNKCCVIVLLLSIIGCKSALHQVEPPKVSIPKIDPIERQKIWSQLLALGHLPLSSLQDCSNDAADQRTLSTYLARVLGELGLGISRTKAELARPEAQYTLQFKCFLNMPLGDRWGCTINSNDLNSSGDLYFGLRFEIDADSQRIRPRSIACE